MKLIDRYEFTNGKAFETWYLEAADTQHHEVPECDVIGLRLLDPNGPVTPPLRVMRPDEALIQARMLIDAVHKATSGFEIKLYESHNGERREVFRAKLFATGLVEDLEEVDHAAAEGEKEGVEEGETESRQQGNQQAQR